MTPLDQAYEMGAKGAEPTEKERLLFEAWMRGHCWMLHGDWDGKTYVHEAEKSGYLHPGAMLTRQVWAAWRDRAALAEQPAQQEPVAWMHEWEDGERIPMLTGRDDRNNDEPISVRPLVYADTSPPAQRTWVGLTKEDRYKAICPLYCDDETAALAACHSNDEYEAIEAKLKEKNT